MNLRHIEVFHAVYVCGSVSAAAKALNVSQPSVSKVLRHAESRVGFALFRRIKGRLIPTEEAHVLFAEAEELYGRIGAMRRTAKNLRGGEQAHLRLGVLPVLGLSVAPTAIAHFRADHRDVTFDIHTLHHEEMFRALHERQADLAFGFEAVAHPRVVSSQIGQGELVVLFRRQDLPDAPPRVALEVLGTCDFIGLAQSGPLGRLFSRELERRGLVLEEAVSVRTFYLAAPLVRHGAGMAVVDEFTAREACASPDLDYRPLDADLTFGVFCMHLEDRQPSKTSAAFVQCMAATLNTRHSLML